MKKYQYLFFDLDGTISDSGPGIVGSVLYAAKQMGQDPGNPKALLKFVGPPLPESFREHFGYSPEEIEQAVKHFRSYYQEKGIFENTMYEGMDSLLEAVTKAGFTCVIATSKPEPFARIIIERYGLAEHFRYIAGSTIEETRTKKDEVIAYALESCGITDPSAVLMVGDRQHDVLGARKNGIDCVGVLYGYGSREELEEAGAIAIAETVPALLSYLLSLS